MTIPHPYPTMPTKRKVISGSAPRGNQPPPTDEWLLNLFQDVRTPSYEDIMRALDMTFDNLIDVRRWLWPRLRSPSSWIPKQSDVDNGITAGVAAPIWAVDLRPSNAWYWAHVEKELYESEEFPWFRAEGVNWRLGLMLVNCVVKKEIKCLKMNPKLRSEVTEREFAFQTFGVEVHDPFTDSTLRKASPKKSKQARTFGYCKVALDFWNRGDEPMPEVWASVLCNGEKNVGPEAVKGSVLVKKIQKRLGDQPFHVGYYRDDDEGRTEWVTVASKSGLKNMFKEQHAKDPSGASLVVVVRQGMFEWPTLHGTQTLTLMLQERPRQTSKAAELPRRKSRTGRISVRQGSDVWGGGEEAENKKHLEDSSD